MSREKQRAARKDTCGLDVARMSEDEATEMLQTARWGSLTEQECPVCHRRSQHWYRRTRKQWRCRYEDCGHNFSVTSSTALANTKLDAAELVFAAFQFVESSDVTPALSVSRHVGLAKKSGFVLAHRFRDALLRTRDPHAQDGLLDAEGMNPRTEASLRLEGDVEIDAAYCCHAVRPANAREHRIDRRRVRNWNPHKRCVVAMRQRGPKGRGATATRVAVIDTEHGFPMDRLVRKYVRPGSTLFSDEQRSYRLVRRGQGYQLHQVDHQLQFVAGGDVHENQAESFFARLRRQRLRMAGGGAKYLLAYANEAAWREDLRRATLREKLLDLLRRCMSVRPSRDWVGYHQGNRQTLDPIWLHDHHGHLAWGRDELGGDRPAQLWAGCSVKGRRHRREQAPREAGPFQHELL